MLIMYEEVTFTRRNRGRMKMSRNLKAGLISRCYRADDLNVKRRCYACSLIAILNFYKNGKL